MRSLIESNTLVVSPRNAAIKASKRTSNVTRICALAASMFLGCISTAHAVDYWSKFPAQSAAGLTQLTGTLHTEQVIFEQLDKRTTIFVAQASTPAWGRSNMLFSNSLIAQTTQVVRAPAGGVHIADPTKAIIRFAAPVADPVIAFYSLDNTGVNVLGNTTVDGAPADVVMVSSDPLKMDAATQSISGPSATGRRLPEGCTTGTYRVCGLFQFKGVYKELTFGQFFMPNTTSQDGVDFQVGFSITPKPVADAGTMEAGVGGVAVADIRTNDTLVGARDTAVAATAANVTVKVDGAWPNGITLNPATGAVSVAPSVTMGVYPLNYLLCDAKDDPANCVKANITIRVIERTPDAANGGNGGGVAPVPVFGLAGLGLMSLGLGLVGLRGRRRQADERGC